MIKNISWEQFKEIIKQKTDGNKRVYTGIHDNYIYIDIESNSGLMFYKNGDVIVDGGENGDYDDCCCIAEKVTYDNMIKVIEGLSNL